ncbi:urea transporter, partial [Salmonella enterica subsp. enterica serovar Typhimurium]
MTTSTTAPSRSPRAPRPLGTALRTVLRGVSQIFFLENSLSGALILGALALMHPWAAVTTALGSAVQALCSAVRHPDE